MSVGSWIGGMVIDGLKKQSFDGDPTPDSIQIENWSGRLEKSFAKLDDAIDQEKALLAIGEIGQEIADAVKYIQNVKAEAAKHDASKK